MSSPLKFLAVLEADGLVIHRQFSNGNRCFPRGAMALGRARTDSAPEAVQKWTDAGVEQLDVAQEPVLRL